MKQSDSGAKMIPYDLASLLRGLYKRVSTQLGVNTLFVSRVARGERRSNEIETALERELKRIKVLAQRNRNGKDGRCTKLKLIAQVSRQSPELSTFLDLPVCHAGPGERRTSPSFPPTELRSSGQKKSRGGPNRNTTPIKSKKRSSG